jgi:uncharacterized membrane protein YraQ (UPF0718 family)
MWILISFAIIALVIFLIMTFLKIEPLISIVVSVLTGLILAYFFERISITYDKDKDNKKEKDTRDNSRNRDSKDSNDSKNVTSIHSSNSNNSNFESSINSSFDYFNKIIN